MVNETVKKWFILLITSLIGITPILIMATNQTMNYVESAYAKRSIPYSCASYHFGMNDNTLMAKTYSTMTAKSSFTLNSNYFVNGISFSSTLLTNVFFDETNNYPVRVGMDRKKGQIKWVSDRAITQCTIYCFTPTTMDLTVNGQVSSIKKGSGYKAYTICDLLYTPYSFDLENTTELKISAMGVYIADITFRVY